VILMAWEKVSDSNVRHIWKCPLCKHGEPIDLPPNWYQDNGTPLCECGEDMEYLYTEIKE